MANLNFSSSPLCTLTLEAIEAKKIERERIPSQQIYRKITDMNAPNITVVLTKNNASKTIIDALLNQSYPNIGLFLSFTTLNNLLKMTKTSTFISFHDPDYLPFPEKIEREAYFLDTHPQLSFITSNHIKIISSCSHTALGFSYTNPLFRYQVLVHHKKVLSFFFIASL